MDLVTQTVVLSRLGLLGVRQRKWSSLVLAGSVGCVVAVLLCMLSIGTGMLHTYRAGEDPGMAIILAPEYVAEYGNGIPRSDVGIILDAPGVARGPDGHPLGDPEVLFWVPPSGAYETGSPMLRGIGPAGFAIRPALHIVAGRRFVAGHHEVIVGIAAARAFGLHVGDTIELPGGAWSIVGTFADAGNIIESVFLADSQTVMTASQMTGFGSLLVQLQSPAAFPSFEHWIASNPALKVTAYRQADYAQRTVNQTSGFFTELTYLVGALMAIGALFGIVKLMYAAVSVRQRELATLRAIGYQPVPVAVAVLVETATLALVGALLGCAIAWLLCNGRNVTEMRNVYDLALSPQLLGAALGLALSLAVLGGLSPAIRAARRSVSDALR